ncbi:MAG: hypothetical protein H6922_02725 [Pseudomonadaceae bacterium]|nr:hypothetical protein [Pseudomonadaceae bacterium]
MDDLVLPPKAAAPAGSVVVMLALNLILLALFILLNAFAKPSQHKQLEAIDGVNEGFDYRESGLGTGSDDTASLGIPWSMALQEGLRGLVHNQLLLDADDAMEVDASGVRVVVPLSALFAEGKTELMADKVGFLENALALMVPEKGAPEGTLELAVGDASDQMMVAAARAQSMATLLAPRGAGVVRVAVRIGEPVLTMNFHYTGVSAAAARAVEGLKPLGAAVQGVEAP